MSTPHAGALYSTTEDLLRWQQALFGHKVLSAASLRKMTAPFKNDYAFGLVVNASNGRKVIQHGDEIDGINTVLSYYPEDQVTVVVFANLNGPAPQETAWKLGALVHGEAVRLISERKEITVLSWSEPFNGFLSTRFSACPVGHGQLCVPPSPQPVP